ncbi:hypothetical protein ACUN0C_05110 [Faunimonas sp. B44]|uniref:hypothetical protein n=1 Tax=Faunimonas sp. B44 TaxID=3461493 RepID=UPI00404396EF
MKRARHRRRHAAEAMAGGALLGGLAGIAATAAMTVAMRRLWRELPARERYPLPPREITERLVDERLPGRRSEATLRHATVAAHFGFGAATGALFPLLFSTRSPAAGAAYGVLVWGASYFGWVPGLRILKPASTHPARRNALMIVAHVVWGAAVASVIGELERAERDAFSSGKLRDASRPRTGRPG